MDMIENYNVISRAKTLKEVQAQLNEIYKLEKKRFKAMNEISMEFTPEELNHLFCREYFLQDDLKSKNNRLYFYKLQPDGYLSDISPNKREPFISKIKKLKIKKWRAVVFLHNYANCRQNFDYPSLIHEINDLQRLRKAKLSKLNS